MWLKLTLIDGSKILMNMDQYQWAMGSGENGDELTFYKDSNDPERDGPSEEILETMDEVWAMMKQQQGGN